MISWVEKLQQLKISEITSNAEEIPAVVYHYTDAAGLLGIIEAQKFWATEMTLLNDPEEYVIGPRSGGLNSTRVLQKLIANQYGQHHKIGLKESDISYR